MKDFQFLQQKYLVNAYANRGVVLVKGDGAFLYDNKGNRYLDMMSNYGVNIFGYNNDCINQKIIPQLNILPTLHCSFNNDTRAIAAEKLVSRCGGNLAQVYFSNSGAEAIETALKFAVLATGKKQFIACKNSYHGKTLGALSATYEQKYKQPFEPLIWSFKHVDFNDCNALEKAINDRTAAFIVEPIQGEGGINLPDGNYFNKVREICDKHNILLIIDEIQTGVGRTGTFLASQKNNIAYDIVCLGKGLAGGIPVGATLVSKKVGLKIPKLIHSSTFGGNPLACAGIIATLDLLDEKMLSHIEKMGNYFLEKLKQIDTKIIKNVRGSGLMIGVEVTDKRNEFLKKLQMKKILAIPAGENVIRFLPPYIIEKTSIDSVISILSEILNYIF